MAMTSKENLIAAIRGEEHDYIPNMFTAPAFCGATALTFDAGPAEGGYDGFGVLWQTSESAGGQACPITTNPVLEDIADWREKVHFPDYENFDWEGTAERQVGQVNREEKAIEFQMWSGHFERLTHLMGFENALCAMYEDPEEVAAFMEALNEYKIGVLRKAAQYYKPDFVTTLDDVATERGLFMSPKLYRELIAPYHKAFNDEARKLGILPFLHCCGKCEDMMQDFVDEGYVMWTSAQPSNDIKGICQRFRGRMAVAGGYDTNGLPGRVDATEEEMRAEVRRCIKDYGSEPNYLFMGFRLAESVDSNNMFSSVMLMDDECRKYGKLR